MPTYDYQCRTCGERFELFQSFSEDTLAKCPTKKSGNSPAGCTTPGRGKVDKVFTAPGITFKGSGFYKNDSRGGSSKNGSSDAEKSGASTTTGSDTSSESGGGAADKTASPPKTTEQKGTPAKSDAGATKKSDS